MSYNVDQLLTRNGLAPECLSLGNLEIVAKLEIIGKVQGVSDSHIAEAFEKVHLNRVSPVVVLTPGIAYRQGIAWLPRSSNELGKHIVLDFDASGRKDDTSGDGEENGKCYSKEDCSHTCVGRPSCHSDDTEDNSNDL
jgi:hypothetical protein